MVTVLFAARSNGSHTLHTVAALTYTHMSESGDETLLGDRGSHTDSMICIGHHKHVATCVNE